MNQDQPLQTQLPPVERLEYLDAMRGFAMTLVVYSHIILLTFKIYSGINYAFILFRMPLFFFLSGFLAYSNRYTIDKIRSKSKKRLRQQLLPTILILAVYALVFGISYGKATANAKLGYWFTISMVETFLLFMVLQYIFVRFNVGTRTRTLVILCVIVALTVLRFLIPELCRYRALRPAIEFWSIRSTSRFALYFFIGVLCKKYYEGFFFVIKQRWLVVVLLPVYVVISVVMTNSPVDTFQTAMGVMGILLVFSIFYQLRHLMSSRTWVGRALIYIGKNTLEIYLLHYFIITVLINIAVMEIQPLFNLVNNPYLEFVIVAAMSLCAIGIILLFNSLLKRYLPRTHHLIFGK